MDLQCSLRPASPFTSSNDDDSQRKKTKTKLVSDLKLRGSPSIEQNFKAMTGCLVHRLKSSCNDCFISKWK